MPVRRRLAVLVASAALLAAPASALAQSAGDDQYEDPFAGQNEGSQQPEATATPAPAPTQAPSTTAPAPTTEAPSTTAPAPVPAPAAASGQPELPRTGLDTGPVLLLGTVLLAGGVALRVRLRARR